MKRMLGCLCFASLMASVTAFAVTYKGTNKAGSGIVGSKHDMLMYQETVKDPQSRACAYCHTPHHALTDTTTDKLANYLPLWSHQITTQTSFVPYYSTTVNVTIGNALRGATLLCMSCHDGVIAIDQHYGIAGKERLNNDSFGGSAVGFANDKNNAGATNLSNDHPIGFSYQEAMERHPGDLNGKDTVWPGSGRSTTARKIKDGLTDGDFFTCASCHDVHNRDNVENSFNGTSNYFLYADQANSAFCLTCHKK